MTTKINKLYTQAAKVACVRNALKELKASYTDNDLLRIFNEATDNCIRGRIIEAVAEGFNTNDWGDGVSASVDMLVYYDGISFSHIRFYVDIKDGGLEVTTDDILVTVDTFRCESK